MIPAHEGLRRLRDGNRRFVSGATSHDTLAGEMRRAALVEGQAPFAVILGCSDSRVPVEIVFDQHLGDLFVVRVAGNIVAPSLVGSVEFAAERFGTRLVVVLGHSRCGAVQATLEALRSPGGRPSPNLRSIVDRIRPSVEELLAADPGRDVRAAATDPASADPAFDELVRRAVRANVRASVDHLRHGSDVLEQQIQRHGLLVVGAEYSLETGEVDFFEGVPNPD